MTMKATAQGQDYAFLYEFYYLSTLVKITSETHTDLQVPIRKKSIFLE